MFINLFKCAKLITGKAENARFISPIVQYEKRRLKKTVRQYYNPLNTLYRYILNIIHSEALKYNTEELFRTAEILV